MARSSSNSRASLRTQGGTCVIPLIKTLRIFNTNGNYLDCLLLLELSEKIRFCFVYCCHLFERCESMICAASTVNYCICCIPESMYGQTLSWLTIERRASPSLKERTSYLLTLTVGILVEPFELLKVIPTHW